MRRPIEACVDANSLCCISEDDFLSVTACGALGGIQMPGSCHGALDDTVCALAGFELGTVVRDNEICRRGEEVLLLVVMVVF